MRLINTRTLKVEEFHTNKRPEYAILSHRWVDGEINFQQIQNPKAYSWMKGYQKVESFCREALYNGYKWAWVDTCCIDKTSASELAEAINSMFAWYRDAAVCYVYLDDFSMTHLTSASPLDIEQELKQCIWFTRGWTLQELIAPYQVLFFDRRWEYFGTKKGLADVISRITNINVTLLRNQKALDEFSCAQKMSWAAFRQTTRPEDRAYSLLGLFGITLPSVYGEGHQAFLRLQEAIITRSPDHSLFAWALEYPVELPTSEIRFSCNPYCILAPSPDCFSSASSIVPFGKTDANSVFSPQDQPTELRTSSELPYTITNMGLQISFLVKTIGQVGQNQIFQAALNCYDESKTHPCACTIYLVQDVRGVQAQRAEPYYVGSVFTDRAWQDWRTSQFLVKPIWIPPAESRSLSYQNERLEVQRQKSQAFIRIKEMRERHVERRARDAERKKYMEYVGWGACGLALLGGAYLIERNEKQRANSSQKLKRTQEREEGNTFKDGSSSYSVEELDLR